MPITNGYAPQNRILGPNGKPWDDDGRLGPDSGFALGHPIQFASIMWTGWRAYIQGRYDEALENDREFAKFMTNDAFLMGLLNERKLGTVSLKWHLEVDNPRDPEEKALKDGLTQIIRTTPDLQKLLWCLLEAIWYGRYGQQLVFEWQNMRLPTDRKSVV